MGERWVWRMCNIWEESTLQFGLGAMWSWGDPGGLQSLKEGFRLSQYSKSSTYEPSGCCGGGLVAKVLFNSYNPMGCSPPGSSVHGISQARILEWVAISFSRGSSWPRDWTQVSCIVGDLLHCKQILYWLSHQGSKLQVFKDVNMLANPCMPAVMLYYCTFQGIRL